jgi:ArsR family transcriptional regulator
MTATTEVIDERALEFKSKIYKVIGDANRIKILEFLRGGEQCQCEIIPIINQSQPTVSRHLRLLEEAGLIRSRRDGSRTLYTTVDERVYEILDALDFELMGILSRELRSRLIS